MKIIVSFCIITLLLFNFSNEIFTQETPKNLRCINQIKDFRYFSKFKGVKHEKFKRQLIPVKQGVILNLGGLFNFDNSTYGGVGGELGLSLIIKGITFSGSLGGASNYNSWLGVSAGYTFGFNKIAPYSLIGLVLLSQEGSYYTLGSFEAGIHIKLNKSIAFRPSFRLAYGKDEYVGYTEQIFNGVISASLTIDPFKLLPYKQ